MAKGEGAGGGAAKVSTFGAFKPIKPIRKLCFKEVCVMKIRDAKQAYSASLNALQARRLALRKTLQEQEKAPDAGQGFDRVELSRELSLLDAQYEAVQGGMEDIMARENMIHDAAAAKQQGEAMAESFAELRKILEVFRRIASGGRVPPGDERKLMEYSKELYMTAKNMALIAAQEDKEYDSLWDDEEEEEEAPPDEIAANAEISAASPEQLAACAEVPAEAPAEGA